eukprot:TRINITY_DN37192_c0_g1_i1.p1 TRINITY_DN37192_c0_g1~~TRINITY_DN37192_c0_g1_i1.p1  ORF type:complete len:138 (+),score=29.21 TRINITY_DN37192_c0_g1_i1:3-416(+)
MIEFILFISEDAVRVRRYMEEVPVDVGLEAAIVNACLRQKQCDPQSLEVLNKEIVFGNIGECTIVFGSSGGENPLLQLHAITELGDLLEQYCGSPLQTTNLLHNVDKLQVLLTYMLGSGSITVLDKPYLNNIMQGVG